MNHNLITCVANFANSSQSFSNLWEITAEPDFKQEPLSSFEKTHGGLIIADIINTVHHGKIQTEKSSVSINNIFDVVPLETFGEFIVALKTAIENTSDEKLDLSVPMYRLFNTNMKKKIIHNMKEFSGMSSFMTSGNKATFSVNLGGVHKKFGYNSESPLYYGGPDISVSFNKNMDGEELKITFTDDMDYSKRMALVAEHFWATLNISCVEDGKRKNFIDNIGRRVIADILTKLRKPSYRMLDEMRNQIFQLEYSIFANESGEKRAEIADIPEEYILLMKDVQKKITEVSHIHPTFLPEPAMKSFTAAAPVIVRSPILPKNNLYRIGKDMNGNDIRNPVKYTNKEEITELIKTMYRRVSIYEYGQKFVSNMLLEFNAIDGDKDIDTFGFVFNKHIDMLKEFVIGLYA
jgi:hypothetical protein